jgi:hypothetical protein
MQNFASPNFCLGSWKRFGDKQNQILELRVQWGCTTGNAATVALSTKKKTSGKDSVIEGQPLLLFM